MKLINNFQLVDLATIIFAAFIFIPQVKATGIPSPWFVGLSIWIVAFILNRRAGAYFKKSKFLLFVVILWIIVLGLTALVGETTIVNRYASMLCIPFAFIIYDFNRFQNKQDVNLRLFVIVTLIAFVPVVPTIIALRLSGAVVRSIKTSGEESLELARLGVGDYSTIYSSVILTLLFTFILLEAKDLLKWKRIYTLITAFFEVAFLVMIVLSNYFTALILTVLGQVALLLMVKHKQSIYFLIPLLIIYGAFSKPINISIIDSSLVFLDAGGKNYNRLMTIRSNIINGYSADDELNSREDTNERAFAIIREYPVEGAVLSGSFNLSNMGQHSTVLDTWGFYGLFIGSLLIIAFSLPLRLIYRLQRNYHSRISVFIVSCIYIVLISVNNLTPHIAFMAFFMMPSLFDSFNNHMSEKGYYSLSFTRRKTYASY